jgi:hypothetical protein
MDKITVTKPPGNMVNTGRMLSSLQEPHGITSQKTAFFIVTAVKTSNVTRPTQAYSASAKGRERENAELKRIWLEVMMV